MYSLILYMLFVPFSDCRCAAVLLLLLLVPLMRILFPYLPSKAQFSGGAEKLKMKKASQKRSK